MLPIDSETKRLKLRLRMGMRMRRIAASPKCRGGFTVHRMLYVAVCSWARSFGGFAARFRTALWLIFTPSRDESIKIWQLVIWLMPVGSSRRRGGEERGGRRRGNCGRWITIVWLPNSSSSGGGGRRQGCGRGTRFELEC